MPRSSTAAVYNPTDSPVVIDDAGRTLEGRCWAAVQAPAGSPAARALAAGRLLPVTRPADGHELHPAAEAALEAAYGPADRPDDLEADTEPAPATKAPPTKRGARKARTTEES